MERATKKEREMLQVELKEIKRKRKLVDMQEKQEQVELELRAKVSKTRLLFMGSFLLLFRFYYIFFTIQILPFKNF